MANPVAKVGTLALAILSGTLAILTAVIGVRHLGTQPESPEWLTAAGGLALVSFGAVQLFLDVKQAGDRKTAAMAKVKPVAWLARRTCETAIIEHDGGHPAHWVNAWYERVTKGGAKRIDVFQQQLCDVVTLAAEAGADETVAADDAFGAFILAANTLNNLQKAFPSGGDADAVAKAVAAGEDTMRQLANVAKKLERFAKRAPDEPVVPQSPKLVWS